MLISSHPILSVLEAKKPYSTVSCRTVRDFSADHKNIERKKESTSEDQYPTGFEQGTGLPSSGSSEACKGIVRCSFSR